ncbi:MAG: succinate dehydrogenase assembly factor 2 [Sphingomonadales bacterium]
MTEQLDNRRKRIRFRSWHRGTKETDLILGSFADHHLAGLDDRQLELFESLLEVADAELLDWISGRLPVPASHDNEVMALLKDFKLPRR